MHAPPGPVVLAGKYRLVRQLGQGGMGTVWLAEHLTLRSPVAVKLIDPRIATEPRFRERFMREARAAAALRSPHVVQILDHGVDGATPYIAMELLEGESLADRLRRVGALSPEETARVITHVGRAISRAHEAGIIHRDLKPANVFLVRNEEEELAKVLDFGIAKSMVEEDAGGAAPLHTESGAMLGTRCYMSPEQAAGAKTVDARADIWAMGVIAFECLLGRRPFEGETLGAFLQAIYGRPPPVPSRCGPVPSRFDDWFARACANDVSARFASAREACAELRAICEGPPTEKAPPSGPWPTAERPETQRAPTSRELAASELMASMPRRSRRVLLAVALAGAAVFGVVALSVTRRQAAAPAAAAARTPPRAPPPLQPAPSEIVTAPPPAPPPPSSPPATGATAPLPSSSGPASSKRHGVRRRPLSRHPKGAAKSDAAATPDDQKVNLGI